MLMMDNSNNFRKCKNILFKKSNYIEFDFRLKININIKKLKNIIKLQNHDACNNYQ